MTEQQIFSLASLFLLQISVPIIFFFLFRRALESIAKARVINFFKNRKKSKE